MMFAPSRPQCAPRRGVAILALLSVIGCVGDSTGLEPEPTEPLDPLIAFSYEPQAGRTRVGVISPDGTGRRFITDGTNFAEMPAWAPDGNTLVMSYQGVADQNPRLWTIALDGTGLRAIPTGDHAGRAPSLSPDGRSIVFDDFNETFIVAREGGTVRELIPSAYEYGVPEWSPDGNWILFTGFIAEAGETVSSRQLYIVRPDGSGLRRLAEQITAPIVYASWSPDSKRIVFDAELGAEGTHELYAVTVSTDDVARLTQTPERERFPAWSPDGTRITFVRDFNIEQHIFTMKLDGTDVRQLTSGAGWYSWPSYRPAIAGP